MTAGITMYRLIAVGLMAMAVYSVFLSLVQVIDFNPIGMVAGLIILFVTTYGTSMLLAYIFRVRTNVESSGITALILYFIFTPPQDANGYAVFALLGLIAAASKYLLAWRGRHIFNPAAIAAVISGASGLAFASWWVATPALFIPILVIAALVLYKTRRIHVGVLFMAIAVLISAVLLVRDGDASVAQFVSLFVSYPFLFFAGFMLSEPLTMPPRRVQRYVYAAGIAVLASAQISVSGVFVTPEIALVVGNIFAFLLGQRHALKLELIGRKPLARGQVEYIFKPLNKIRYIAGQYLELQLPSGKLDPRGSRRMFTLSSSPTEENIRIAMRHSEPSSEFKKDILKLPIGAVATATGVYGDFLLPKKPTSEKLLFIAGGIGVTPFRSHLAWLRDSNILCDGVLLYFVKQKDDVIYSDVLDAESHGFKVVIVEGTPSKDILSQEVQDIASRTVYVSGPPTMVNVVDAMAASLGATKIKKDYFTGY